MAVDRVTFEKAAAIQKEFEDRFAGQPDIVGIGLGLNAKADSPAINVQVKSVSAGSSLPRTFRDLEVVVDVVGETKAF